MDYEPEQQKGGLQVNKKYYDDLKFMKEYTKKQMKHIEIGKIIALCAAALNLGIVLLMTYRKNYGSIFKGSQALFLGLVLCYYLLNKCSITILKTYDKYQFKIWMMEQNADEYPVVMDDYVTLGKMPDQEETEKMATKLFAGLLGLRKRKIEEEEENK